jgi:hypothetical protein
MNRVDEEPREAAHEAKGPMNVGIFRKTHQPAAENLCGDGADVPVDLRDACYELPALLFSSVVRMTRRVVVSSREPDEHPTCHERVTISKLLNGLAANPWALACAGFVLTALLIQSNTLSAF